MTDAANRFLAITYRIDQSGGQFTGENREVKGFAYNAPGWPEFHVCIRRGDRFWHDRDDSQWVVDHFESGLAVSGAGYHETKEEAAKALVDLLNKMGKRKVRKALKKKGLL